MPLPNSRHSLSPAGAFFFPGLGKTFTTLYGISDASDDQVADTIRLMQKFVYEDAQRPEIKHALGLTRLLCPNNGQRCLAETIWRWVWSSCRFVDDDVTAEPLTAIGYSPIVEVLVRPVEMLRVRQGDCDDFSMLVAALLAAAGISWRFVTIAADPTAPQDFSHVYVMAYPDGTALALDASHGAYAGWQAPRAFRRKEWVV